MILLLWAVESRHTIPTSRSLLLLICPLETSTNRAQVGGLGWFESERFRVDTLSNQLQLCGNLSVVGALDESFHGIDLISALKALTLAFGTFYGCAHEGSSIEVDVFNFFLKPAGRKWIGSSSSWPAGVRPSGRLSHGDSN